MQDDEPTGLGFGSRRRGAGGGRKLSALGWIIVVNAGVFLFQHLLFVENQFEKVRGVAGGVPWGFLNRATLMNGEVWRLVTNLFVHGNFMHIAFNMVGVYFVGKAVLPRIGTKHFLWLYFLSGIAGSVAHVCITEAPIVGASGALFGLLVMMGMILWDTPLTFFNVIRLRARILVLSMVAVNLVMFLLSILAGPSADLPLLSGVAHIAHLGGALIGFYYAKFLGLGGKTPSIAELRSERWKNESSLPNQPKRKGWTSKFSKDKIVEVKRAEIKKKELSVELDEILDKISAHGMHSLTDAEKAILEKGSKDLAERAK